MHLIFFKLKKLKKHAFILDSSVEKLKNYGNIFCKLKKLKKYGYNFYKLTKHRFDFLRA